MPVIDCMQNIFLSQATFNKHFTRQFVGAFYIYTADFLYAVKLNYVL